jgi:Fe2+ or Zn2+ uptake regulation protein
MTPQRALVLDALETADDHLDAEGIWKRLREKDETINLATVYRTLAILKEMGLVDQRYFARDHKREVYEPINKPEHYHFTCVQCGNVLEFETQRILQARSELEENEGVNLTHVCICFEGYCASCKPQTKGEGITS